MRTLSQFYGGMHITRYCKTSYKLVEKNKNIDNFVFTNYFFVLLYLYGIGFFDSVPSFIILLHLHLVRVSVIFLSKKRSWYITKAAFWIKVYLVAVRVKVLGIPLSKESEERLGSSVRVFIIKPAEEAAVMISPRFHSLRYTFSEASSS